MKLPIISISGIRGIFGESLTPENIVKYAAGFAKYTGNKKIVIGRDGRMGGELVEKLVEAALLFCGCSVVNIGIAPTPTISLAVETLKAAGGIAITASHNPQEYNGMKFISSKGIFLDAAENAKLWKCFDDLDGAYVTADKVKQVEYYPGFMDFHIARVLDLSAVDVNRIRKRKHRCSAN